LTSLTTKQWWFHQFQGFQGQGIADDKKHDDIHEPIAEGDLPTGVPRDDRAPSALATRRF